MNKGNKFKINSLCILFLLWEFYPLTSLGELHFAMIYFFCQIVIVYFWKEHCRTDLLAVNKLKVFLGYPRRKKDTKLAYINKEYLTRYNKRKNNPAPPRGEFSCSKCSKNFCVSLFWLSQNSGIYYCYLNV